MRARHLAIATAVGALALAACAEEWGDSESNPNDEAKGHDAGGAEADAEGGESDTPMRDLDEGPPEHLIWLPDDVDWQEGPASFEEGSEYAMLEGEFDRDAVFTARFRLPDGFVINPHWHPNVERVTVLEGTFHLGQGEEVDHDAAIPLEAGSHTSMPPEMVHYAIAEGETVIQLTSVGPWEINYVDPADDPRER